MLHKQSVNQLILYFHIYLTLNSILNLQILARNLLHVYQLLIDWSKSRAFCGFRIEVVITAQVAASSPTLGHQQGARAIAPGNPEGFEKSELVNHLKGFWNELFTLSKRIVLRVYVNRIAKGFLLLRFVGIGLGTPSLNYVPLDIIGEQI
jgi:hypothetical protein